MKHHSTTEETQEQAALCALGALSQHDARAFAAHVREGCAVCERELNEFNEVVDALASAAAPVAPPAYVRDLLVARIDRERPEAQSSASVIRFPEHTATKQEPGRSSSSIGAVLPWAIAATLLIACAYSIVMWRTEHRALQAELGRASDVLQENNELSAQLRQEKARSTEMAQINSVLSSPQWRIIPLAGQQPAPDSSARIYWDIQGKRWVVTADLPPAPAGKVYQLWFVTPSAKISAGLIRADEKGHCFSIIEYPSNVDQLAAAAITLEPEGGSAQPTMPIYALGKSS
ncbi:MAG TPA: anti-sigma factor [Blastocatellia bacterium]|nr:anti-sigma factor [Blastocatellia bacterium]